MNRFLFLFFIHKNKKLNNKIKFTNLDDSFETLSFHHKNEALHQRF